ncbi:peptide/nickel transport system permease protein [Amycolatopsis xylanica]|uniref:Peptide/nickel transport system permease protein n=1 Tax=Amycolatopsis xylanica TaxID=589385 RepID=A0A1H3P7X8_9PSEU|nr:ABC transporter permease [Amycolatopsis xylanica]SDY97274.1 peptide/nickel transport system permease protein [Amycolatopsis xylanica]
MLAFLARRVLGAVVILLIISAITFLLFFAVPGNEVAALSCGKSCTPVLVEQIRRDLGLDQPVWQQYLVFIGGIFAGRVIGDKPCDAPCLGYSFVNKEPVLDTVLDRLPVTISLAIGAVVLFLIFGVGLGMLAALRKGKLADKISMIFALLGGSMQIYVMAPFFLYIFVYSSDLLPRPTYTSFFDSPAQWVTGLILPWTCLAIIHTAYYARLTRSSMVDVLNEDYIRTVRAKGLSTREVYVKHAFRGAMSPIATILGLDIAVLFAGAIITETSFGLIGVGQLAVNSVFASDLPMMMGVVLLAATAVVVANIVVDIVYAVIDPRIKVA